MIRRRKMWWYFLPLLVAVYGAILLCIRWASPAPTLGVGEDGRLRPCPDKPNCVCSQATDGGHQIAPFAFTDAPEQAWQRLRNVLDATPRIFIVEATDTYLRAEAVTLVWRFIDDLEFSLDAAGKVIHCRSSSRLGYGDLGVNRGRVESLRAAFAGR